MKITVVNEPYDDDKLVFNEKTGRYELALPHVKSQFDITFRDDGILQRRITKNSRKIYNVIYARSNSYNKGVIAFCLNRTKEGRRWLYDLLMEQIEADLETGFNDLSSQPAINYMNGRITPREEQIRNQITVDTEQVLDRSVDYFGINLMYQSMFPSYVFIYVANASKV